MKNIIKSTVLVLFFVPKICGSSNVKSDVPGTKKGDSSKSAQPIGGVVFNGMTENGVKRNTFLCGYTLVDKKHGVDGIFVADDCKAAKLSKAAGFDISGLCSYTSAEKKSGGGLNVEADDCKVAAISRAVGFDVSGGQTLQFFNNFTYWLKEKTKKEQSYKINDQLDGDDLEKKMDSEGWGSMGAYCIIVTTNQMLQKVIAPDMVVDAGQVKVIVQLWYNGGNLIQLWSQDVKAIAQGKSFAVAITNDEDSSLKQALTVSTKTDQYFSAVTSMMQPDNRLEEAYNAASTSPRKVRIVVA